MILCIGLRSVIHLKERKFKLMVSEEKLKWITFGGKKEAATGEQDVIMTVKSREMRIRQVARNGDT